VSAKEKESPPRVQMIPAQHTTQSHARSILRVWRTERAGPAEEAPLSLDSCLDKGRLMRVNQGSGSNPSPEPGIVPACLNSESV